MPTNKLILGEDTRKRTRNSKTFFNFDGSFTTQIFIGPVHFDDEHGNLHNINTDLFDEADFDVIDEPVSREINARFKQAKLEVRKAKEQRVLNRDNHNFQALRVPFDCHIPRNFQRGYTIGKGQDKITFKPVNSSPAKGYVSESDRSIINYQDAWNDTDVQLQVQTNGLKETIFLKSNKAPTSFSFEVQGKDIAEDFTAGALKLMPAWLRDANGVERDVEMKVVQQNDNKVYVELDADVEGLVHPIEIDPTVVIQPDETTSKDTFIREQYLGNNYGTSTSLYLGALSGYEYNILLQFDLSQINGNITQAILSLYMSSYNTMFSTTAYAIPATENWDESTVSWNTSPATDTSKQSTFLLKGDSTTGDKYNNYDITTAIQNDIGNGFLLKTTSSNSGSYAAFDSSGWNNKPKLSVTYNTPPTEPTIIKPNGGETWNSLHTIELIGGVDVVTIDTGYAQSHSNVTNLQYNQTKVFQSFTTPSNLPNLTKVKAILTETSSTQVKVAICNVDASGIPTTEITSVIAAPSLEFEVNINAQLNPNQKYAVVYEYIDGVSKFSYTDANIYPGGNQGYYYGGNWTSNGPFDFRMEIIFNDTNLQHQIQLSTDAARTDWRDIVGLTAPGVTQYEYDFINEPESSVALVRARAFDGTSYGPWDESDGVFTIQHNQAPTAPTNLSPSGGQSVDRAQSVRASWLHNDPDNSDPQSKFDLRWRIQGNTTWNTISQVTINQFYDLINLPYGNIEWQVRTYDQAGLSSPYSAIEVFLAGDKPVAPTIVSPGENVSVANPTVQWSSVGQVGYKLRVKDDLGTEVYSHTGGTNKAHTVQYDLANQTDYTIEASITNADGLESDVDNLLITVSYTPPAKAQVNTSSNSDNASITLQITNPVPVGTEPAVSHNNIYRRIQGESEFIRIVTNIAPNTSFVDYTPASGKQYEYQVRAWGDNGTYSDSNVVSESVSFKNVRLSLASDPSESIQLKYNGERSFDVNFKHSTKQFAGRKRPITTFSEIVNNDLGISYLVDLNDFENLQEMLFKREVMIYRDLRGRKYFVTAGAFSVSDELVFEHFEVSLPLNEVDHSEVV